MYVDGVGKCSKVQNLLHVSSRNKIFFLLTSLCTVLKGTIVPVKTKKFGRRYPWQSWFANARFSLVRGRDYDCLTSNMAQMVYRAAATASIKVAVATADDESELLVTVVKR